MARLLALEWDGREARIAVARTRGKEAVLEHAFAVDLAPRDGGAAAAEVNVGDRIAAALAARRIGRCETFVAVGRTSIELRRLSLPPAPPEDLPDMVRFQAMRDFAGLGEDWPLDFVPLDDAPADGAASVLAAVIAPKLVAQIRQTCEAAGLEMERLVLRPFAAASLLRRARPSQECRMLVDLLSDEADLTVLIGGTVVFVRTVRLPAAEEEAQMRALLGEARRTIAAAQNQLGGRRVERLVLCGEQDRLAPVESLVAEQLSLPVESFDPFSAAETDGELRDDLPDHSGRFAPLVGMLLDEAAQSRPDIDFLHPRRRPAPPSKRRQHVLIGATAAAVVLLGVFLVWMKQSGADQEIRKLQAEVHGLDKDIAEARTTMAKAEDVDEFLQGHVIWLDEIKTVSEELPPGEHVLVSQLSAIANPDGGGQLILNGYAQEAVHTSQMVQNLNDGVREASGKGAQENNQRSDYPWRFDNLTIRVPPPGDEPADAE